MNILVICADTFRADYLGCYGNSWIKTPHIDKLAGEGIRFDEFYGEALPTIPARRVLYTGRKAFPFSYHQQKGDMVQLPGWHPLYDEDITLAEHLSDLGYTTGLVSDLYHMMKPGKNFHRGFHSWEWIRGQEADPFIPTSKPNQNVSKYIGSKVDINPGKHRLMSQYLNNRSWWKDESDHFAGQVMQSAASWITRYGSKKPWMLWVESFDPHEPWDAPKEFLELYSSTNYQGKEPIWPSGLVDNYTKDEFNRIKAHYAGECSHVDRWVGHIVETLKSQHLLNDTIVVFMSDHGCIMGEQGQIHKGQDRLRIQATRCPLIIRMPEAQYAGTVVDGFVQHQDIMPTLLGLIEQHVPKRCNGQNFWPLVTKKEPIDLHDIIVSGFGWYASVRTAGWNYQAPWTEADNQRPPELYNRKKDPDELINAIEDYPSIAKDLQAHLDKVMRTTHLTEGQLGQISETDTPAAVPGVKW